jgi:hypothetical protein
LQLNMFQLKVGFGTQAVANSNPTPELRHLSFNAHCKSYLF